MIFFVDLVNEVRAIIIFIRIHAHLINLINKFVVVVINSLVGIMNFKLWVKIWQILKNISYIGVTSLFVNWIIVNCYFLYAVIPVRTQNLAWRSSCDIWTTRKVTNNNYTNWRKDFENRYFFIFLSASPSLFKYSLNLLKEKLAGRNRHRKFLDFFWLKFLFWQFLQFLKLF